MNEATLYLLALKRRYEEAYADIVCFEDFLVAKLYVADVPVTFDKEKEKELHRICMEEI